MGQWENCGQGRLENEGGESYEVTVDQNDLTNTNTVSESENSNSYEWSNAVRDICIVSGIVKHRNSPNQS
jgi:hypothetical protein